MCASVLVMFLQIQYNTSPFSPEIIRFVYCEGFFCKYNQIRIQRILSSVIDRHRYKKNVLDTLAFSEIRI